MIPPSISMPTELAVLHLLVEPTEQSIWSPDEIAARSTAP